MFDTILELRDGHVGVEIQDFKQNILFLGDLLVQDGYKRLPRFILFA